MHSPILPRLAFALALVLGGLAYVPAARADAAAAVESTVVAPAKATAVTAAQATEAAPAPTRQTSAKAHVLRPMFLGLLSGALLGLVVYAWGRLTMKKDHPTVGGSATS